MVENLDEINHVMIFILLFHQRESFKFAANGIAKSTKNCRQLDQEHGVRYFDELTNMAQLTEEVGEVARIIARRYGEQSEREHKKKIWRRTRRCHLCCVVFGQSDRC